MKSENKWSDKDVDELLTSFFQAEMPARLDGPMPAALRQVRSQPAVAGQVPVANSPTRWVTMAMVACAAALMLAVAAFQFSGGDDSSSTIAERPGESDVINVNSGETGESDFTAPEQEIDILDEEAGDE